MVSYWKRVTPEDIRESNISDWTEAQWSTALKKAWSSASQLWRKNGKDKSTDNRHRRDQTVTQEAAIAQPTVTTLQPIAPFDFDKFEEVLNRSNDRFAKIIETAFAPLTSVVNNFATQMIEFKTEMTKLQQTAPLYAAEIPLAICDSPRSDIEITGSVQMPEEEEEKIETPKKRKIEESDSDSELANNSELYRYVKLQKNAEREGLIVVPKKINH